MSEAEIGVVDTAQGARRAEHTGTLGPRTLMSANCVEQPPVQRRLWTMQEFWTRAHSCLQTVWNHRRRRRGKNVCAKRECMFAVAWTAKPRDFSVHVSVARPLVFANCLKQLGPKSEESA